MIMLLRSVSPDGHKLAILFVLQQKLKELWASTDVLHNRISWRLSSKVTRSFSWESLGVAYSP